jgi:hypothetical protein
MIPHPAEEVLMATTSKRLAVGKPRTIGGGQRAWRSALYSPGGRYSLYRVVFKEEIAEG